MTDQKILDQIKSYLAQGKSKEELYKELLAQGLTIETIQENLSRLTSTEEKEDPAKRTILIIIAIGTALIGAGIFSFIAANWQVMSRPVKVGIILLAMLLAHGTGWYFKEKLNAPRIGEALILLGTIIYGSGIFLVAQIFNIRTNWPDGFILWMIGAITMALAVEAYSLFYLAIPLGLAALFGHGLGGVAGLGHSALLFTSSLLLLLATIITFAAGWRINRKKPPALKDIY